MTPRQEAEAIAGRIRTYWASRGLFPIIWVEQAVIGASQTDTRVHWVIRSDMANGCPRSASGFHCGPNSDSPGRIHAVPCVHHAGERIESAARPKSPWSELAKGIPVDRFLAGNSGPQSPSPHHGA